MDIDESKPGEDGKKDTTKVAAEKKEEPPTHQLSNPARIVPAQERLVSFPGSSRWQPLRSSHVTSGILVLRDARPGQSPPLRTDRSPACSPLPSQDPPPPRLRNCSLLFSLHQPLMLCRCQVSLWTMSMQHLLPPRKLRLPHSPLLQQPRSKAQHQGRTMSPLRQHRSVSSSNPWSTRAPTRGASPVQSSQVLHEVPL